MDVNKILTELREEKEMLCEAINALEVYQRQADGKPLLKRRGRPPGSKNKKMSPLQPLIALSAAS
jgi:hypothetical protein